MVSLPAVSAVYAPKHIRIVKTAIFGIPDSMPAPWSNEATAPAAGLFFSVMINSGYSDETDASIIAYRFRFCNTGEHFGPDGRSGQNLTFGAVFASSEALKYAASGKLPAKKE